MWGENMDFANPNGFLDTPDAVRRGITSVRFPMRTDSPLDLISAYQASGIYMLGIYDSIAHGQNAWVPELDAYQGCNEPDVTGQSSWTMTPAAYVALIQKLRGDHPHAHLIGAGMASRSAMYLKQCMAIADLTTLLDGFAWHFYGGDWSQVRTLLRTFKADWPNMAHHVTEYDPVSNQATTLPRWVSVFNQEAVMHWHFCVTDAMVSPLGLTDTNGQDKPQMRSMMAMR